MYFCTMFSGKLHIILLIFIVLVGFSSCSGYEKLLKSNDYRLQYDRAVEYFENEEYVRAGGLFEKITTVYRGTTRADTVFNYQARSFLMQRDYTLAGYHFKNLATNYPNSAFAEEADYMTAYCYYMLSPKPSLDQENTMKAITAFQLYMIKYPGAKKKEEAEGYIAEMRNKIVEKSYMSAKLYYNLSDYKASIIALQNSLEEFPDTEHREELMFLLLKSNFLLALNSIPEKQAERYQDAVDKYYAFAGEFPESMFKKEADRIYNETLQQLGDTSLLGVQQ